MVLDGTLSQRDGGKSAAIQMADEPVAFCQPCALLHHLVEDPNCPRHYSRAASTALMSLHSTKRLSTRHNDVNMQQQRFASRIVPSGPSEQLTFHHLVGCLIGDCQVAVESDQNSEYNGCYGQTQTCPCQNKCSEHGVVPAFRLQKVG